MPGEARCRSTAQRQAEMMHEHVETRRPPSARRKHRRLETLGEDPLRAGWYVASETSRDDADAHGSSGTRQVRNTPDVAAMDPSRVVSLGVV